METIANRLKELRKQKNVTQEEIAKLLNITRPAYAQYETGKNIPPIENLIKIADYYRVSLDYLTGRY